jgi:hypothetical protein
MLNNKRQHGRQYQDDHYKIDILVIDDLPNSQLKSGVLKQEGSPYLAWYKNSTKQRHNIAQLMNIIFFKKSLALYKKTCHIEPRLRLRREVLRNFM